jgi:hypothetical protein
MPSKDGEVAQGLPEYRHSGESRYPLPPSRGKVGWGYIVYWMPVVTGMTVKTL